jgi:hypothetical protein
LDFLAVAFTPIVTEHAAREPFASKYHKCGWRSSGIRLSSAGLPVMGIPAGLPAMGIPAGLPAMGIPAGLPAMGIPAGLPAMNKASLTTVGFAVLAPSLGAIRPFRFKRGVSRTPGISTAEGLMLGLATKPLAIHS